MAEASTGVTEAPTWKSIRLQNGDRELSAGPVFKAGKLHSVEQVRAQMAKVFRATTSGQLEVKTGLYLVKMLESILKAIATGKDHEHKEKTLEMMRGGEMLGVFQGFMIVPPKQRQVSEMKLIDATALEVDGGMKIVPPKPRKGK